MAKRKRGIEMEYAFGRPTQKYLKYDLKPVKDEDAIRARIAGNIQRGCEKEIMSATKQLIQLVSLMVRLEKK